MNNTKKNLTHADLAQFSGDLTRYRTFNSQVIYTPGVRYVAEHGEAYWLIDAIASYFGSDLMQSAFEKDQRLESLRFWRLNVQNDQSAELIAQADSNVKPFIRQSIPFTDFPLSHVRIWAGFDGTYWTLYLPSEH